MLPSPRCEERVFGIEALAVDPLFVHLAGGTVPSIDTIYRDLCRFDEDALEALHSMVVDHGLALVARRKHRFVHIDVDTTVEPLFGMQQGALPGPNPRYHGRPSYHPILARVAEVDAIVGAKLRPGDTSFGEADVPFVEECINRVRTAAPSAVLYVRIDGAGDCSALMHAVAAKGCFFLTKAGMSADLVGIVAHATGWRTIDWDRRRQSALTARRSCSAISRAGDKDRGAPAGVTREGASSRRSKRGRVRRRRSRSMHGLDPELYSQEILTVAPSYPLSRINTTKSWVPGAWLRSGPPRPTHR
ncbi:uncharacterized protein SOCE26_050740 [Sorangium cellulosum]|uniref:Transposase DDE domain-containing protein n=1 Tax=Sorangium cellulosum TaxID=56 RepID=A0A2L0EWF6_SORCE|nr:transposase [Sorangium cellulosum]AUX43622.1 uncharacterized protein SOCE26_050740 [Sorangium cellulosum]